MVLNIYNDSVINELKNNIEYNFEKYKNGEKFVANVIDNYVGQLYALPYDVDYPKLDCTVADKISDSRQWEIDCNNAILLHKEFVLKYKIPASIFTDERFIAYLTHDIYFDYMMQRWPITDKINRVKTRYFLESTQGFTRNAFLRLFWYAYMTYDETNKDPYWLTKIAFSCTDPVNQIMERKYSKNRKILKASLKALQECENIALIKNKRTLFGKAINNILGLYCLDVLTEGELESVFKKELMQIILGNQIDELSEVEEDEE